MSLSTVAPRRTRFPALGTTAVVVVTDPDALGEATEAAMVEIAAVDAACSRFRPDSELCAVNDGRGQPVSVSTTLLEAVDTALAAASATDGLVDPTVGRVMRVLGYERSFELVDRDGPPVRAMVGSVPGWQVVRVDRTRNQITVPAGVELDLGATAKAWCADRAAEAAAAQTGAGVLVSLGGDIAVAGPAPRQGWLVRLAEGHDEPTDGPGPSVSIHHGGLATSSTVGRRWQRGDDQLHHVMDPRTGRPANTVWRTVTVAAATCAGANTASTAAVVLGDAAADWLAARGLPARLVRHSREVVLVAGWPSDESNEDAVAAGELGAQP